METYEFLILGGGITGLQIGKGLRNKGFKTLNVDRSMDLGYPVSGSCFVSIEIFNRYFRKYEKHVNGIFSSIIIENGDSEEEMPLPPEKNIISMDREKIVRDMAADLSASGGKIYIASTISLPNVEKDGKLMVALKREGKDETVEVHKIILATGNPEEKFLTHQKDCRISRINAIYERGRLGKFPAESFRVKLNNNGILVEAIYMGSRETLQINGRKGPGISSEAIFKYDALTHNCFPSTVPFIIASGNMLGTENYTGAGIGFSMDYNNYLIENLEKENSYENLRDWYVSKRNQNNFLKMDPVDSILYRIPIYS